MDVLYVVERGTAAFEAARNNVDVVCAGDSLTGWNNYGLVHYWPYPTYPPYSYYPPGYVAATSLISFGVGMAVGSALWGGCNWGGGTGG